jgi:hypothetical protein
MTKLSEIEVATVSDTRNFRVGDTYVMTRSGPRRVAGWFGVRYRVAQWAYGMTRWWRPRTVCSAIDVEAGSITIAYEEWSWRRWRWERA